MNRTFLEYYRCPEEFALCSASGEPAGQSGHFRFGPDAICFGSLRKGSVRNIASGNLHDAWVDAVAQPGSLNLTFDPDQVIDNLRLERYCAASNCHSVLSSRLANTLYYLARPFLGVRVRRHLQKLRLADWRSIPFPRWPVDPTVEQVHEMVLRLCIQARGGEKVPFIWFWPDGFPGCAIVTHDVEAVKGRDFCQALMDIDEGFGIHSSFQLVPEERYAFGPTFMEEIRARGFEINVHDLNHDGRLFASRPQFFERVRRINQYGRAFGAQGFRSGALYRNLAWYDALDFSYDMSVPNAGHLDPQRGGCCTVMPYFIGKILELPVTTTQDYSLFHILNQNSIDLWKLEISQILEKRGLASFIVHPDYILEPRLRRTYKSLLGYLSVLRAEGKLWIALPRDVNHWWRARDQMKLVRKGNMWAVEGPGKHRARVAYAFLDGERLIYELAHVEGDPRSGRRLGAAKPSAHPGIFIN
jgi:hypothetical protein